MVAAAVVETIHPVPILAEQAEPAVVVMAVLRLRVSMLVSLARAGLAVVARMEVGLAAVTAVGWAEGGTGPLQRATQCSASAPCLEASPVPQMIGWWQQGSQAGLPAPRLPPSAWPQAW